jgi:hypothetical protein
MYGGCLSVHLSVCCLSVSLSVCLSVSLSVYLSVCLSLSQSFCLLSVYLSVCLPLSLCVCVCVSLSVLLFCLSSCLSVCLNADPRNAAAASGGRAVPRVRSGDVALHCALVLHALHAAQLAHVCALARHGNPPLWFGPFL